MSGLTTRLLRVNNDLRDIRIDLHNLALVLLQDEAGLSSEAYERLQRVFREVGCLAEINANERADGRFYIPPMAKVKS
jgi:hypothetical protein